MRIIEPDSKLHKVHLNSENEHLYNFGEIYIAGIYSTEVSYSNSR